MEFDPLERGSAAVAAICLGAACFGFASDSIGEVHGHAPMIVAAIGPQEAQQWLDVGVSAANKLFTLINVMIGIWQTAAVFHHRRVRRRTSRGKGGRVRHGAPPHTGGDAGIDPPNQEAGRPPVRAA